MIILRYMACFFLILLGSACSNYGSVQLPMDRVSYNKSLQYSDNQQLLLNIVRLRYTDTPYFLSVSNIVSQFNYQRNINATVQNNSPPPSLLGTLTGGVSLTESPTITYTPLQGSEYIRKLLTPIDLGVAYLLIRAGWNADKVFRLLIQRLGPLDNAVIASRAPSMKLPLYKKFQELSLALRAVEYTDVLSVTPDYIDKRFCLKLMITDFNQLTPPQRLFFAKVGITRKSPALWIVSWMTNKPHQFFAQTRTMLGLLNYLSKSVELPPQDVKNDRVKVSYQKNGQPFDWRQITVGEMVIRTSKSQPHEHRLAVQYRGSWFYIADNDFESKETLSMLSVVMGIYQGEIKSFLPIFTVS